MSIWKEESFEDKIYDEVESFFNIHELKEEDETLALDIIDSLRDKNILVVEKDDNNYGYLAKEKSLLFNKLQPTKEDKIKCLTGSL